MNVGKVEKHLLLQQSLLQTYKTNWHAHKRPFSNQSCGELSKTPLKEIHICVISESLTSQLHEIKMMCYMAPLLTSDNECLLNI